MSSLENPINFRLMHRINLSKRRSTTNSFQYTFVTFNYTDVLDQIVEKIKKSGTFDKRTVNGHTILDDLEPVLNVHGTLSDALVLGLNDEL